MVDDVDAEQKYEYAFANFCGRIVVRLVPVIAVEEHRSLLHDGRCGVDAIRCV